MEAELTTSLMSAQEAYIMAAVDMWMGNFIPTFHQAYVWKVMKNYDYSMPWLYFAMMCGYVAAVPANWGLGVALRSVPVAALDSLRDHYHPYHLFLQKHLLLGGMLMLSCLPVVGNVVVLLAGVIKVPLWRVMVVAGGVNGFVFAYAVIA